MYCNTIAKYYNAVLVHFHNLNYIKTYKLRHETMLKARTPVIDLAI